MWLLHHSRFDEKAQCIEPVCSYSISIYLHDFGKTGSLFFWRFYHGDVLIFCILSARPSEWNPPELGNLWCVFSRTEDQIYREYPLIITLATEIGPVEIVSMIMSAFTRPGMLSISRLEPPYLAPSKSIIQTPQVGPTNPHLEVSFQGMLLLNGGSNLFVTMDSIWWQKDI